MVPPIPAPSAALVPTSAFVGVPPGTCRVRLSSVIWVPPSDESAATQPNVMLREQGPCLGGAAHVLASTCTWGADVASGPRRYLEKTSQAVRRPIGRSQIGRASCRVR